MTEFFYKLSLLWRKLMEYLGILRVNIDIGNEEIRIIEAYRFLGSFSILSTSSERIPEGSDLSFSIERFMQRYATHQVRRVNLTLSSTSIIPLFLSFPGLPKEKIQSAILWEIERNIPLPLEEAYYSYKIVSKSQEDLKSVWNILAVVAKKEVVHSYLKAFQKMNILVEEVSYLPINILSSLELPHSQNSSGYLFISTHTLELYIIKQKKIVAFDHYIGDFSRITAVTVRNIVDTFANYIQMRVSFLEKITVISKDDIDVDDLVQNMTDSLNIFTQTASTEDFHEDLRQKDGSFHLYDLLGFTKKSYLNLPIEPESLHKSHSLDRLSRAGMIAFVLLDLLSICFLPKMLSTAKNYAQIELAQNSDISEIRDSEIYTLAVKLSNVAVLQDYEAEQAELLTKIAEIESLGIDSSNLKVTLSEICRLIPDVVWLDALYIDDGTGEMIGYSETSEGLQNFVLFLVESRVVDEVKLSSAQLDSGALTAIEFSITFEVAE